VAARARGDDRAGDGILLDGSTITSCAVLVDGGGKESNPAASPLQPEPSNGNVVPRADPDASGEGDAWRTATSGRGVFVDR
jgi:hypothetical protein